MCRWLDGRSTKQRSRVRERPGREATPGQPSRSRGGSLCRYVYLCVSLSQSAFYSHALVFLNTPASIPLTAFRCILCTCCVLFCLFPNSFFYVPVFHAEIFQNITRNQNLLTGKQTLLFCSFCGSKIPAAAERQPPQTTTTSGVKRAHFSFNLAHQLKLTRPSFRTKIGLICFTH